MPQRSNPSPSTLSPLTFLLLTACGHTQPGQGYGEGVSDTSAGMSLVNCDRDDEGKVYAP